MMTSELRPRCQLARTVVESAQYVIVLPRTSTCDAYVAMASAIASVSRYPELVVPLPDPRSRRSAGDQGRKLWPWTALPSPATHPNPCSLPSSLPPLASPTM